LVEEGGGGQGEKNMSLLQTKKKKQTFQKGGNTSDRSYKNKTTYKKGEEREHSGGRPIRKKGSVHLLRQNAEGEGGGWKWPPLDQGSGLKEG